MFKFEWKEKKIAHKMAEQNKSYSIDVAVLPPSVDV